MIAKTFLQTKRGAGELRVDERVVGDLVPSNVLHAPGGESNVVRATFVQAKLLPATLV
jgi:hypothetical protein